MLHIQLGTWSLASMCIQEVQLLALLVENYLGKEVPWHTKLSLKESVSFDVSAFVTLYYK